MAPLCFMVMPFGRKPTQAEPGAGPAEVDFNKLWDLAYVPVIRELGYEPVRADQDTGSLIVTQMLERLYFADLVLADMSIPNGNVYYEVGIRHAARADGCVLLAADWSRQLFDVAQMRTVRYPLPEGELLEATARGVQAAIREAIPRLARGGSPMHGSIPGYPDQVDPQAASTMKERMADQAAFQAQLRALRTLPRSRRMEEARAFAAARDPGGLSPPAAIALLLTLRDCVQDADDWRHVLEFVERLPEWLREAPEVREQQALALSKVGRHAEAVVALQRLIELQGATPERLGLLGGRYKQLHREAAPEDRADLLDQAIRAYERGMELDLNEYYCSSNLPRLYRLRGRRGDEERAQTVLRGVMLACERAIRRGSADAWLRPTLLVAAFDSADADKAEELAERIADESPARWQLDSVRPDLETAVQQVRDASVQQRLRQLIDRFKS